MKKYIVLSAFLCLGLGSCFDLDKMPEGELSSMTAFGTTAEISKYLNQFYEGTLRKEPNNSSSETVSNSAIRVQSNNVGQAEGIAFGDLNSDNMQSNVINTRLAGETALSSATELKEYYAIRSLNFLINNIGNCADQTSEEYKQCVGEAYYFRACYYYQLLINYGGVTWLTEVLNPVQEEMQLPRASRTELADHILDDLDLAITNLNEQTTNATMRVHKDVARALKSEVALFEGTWEKYHKIKNTPFYDKAVTDEKINDYLEQAAAAAYEVMEGGSWSIYKTGTEPYRDLFTAVDLSGNQEVLWWKKYDAASNIGHSVTRFLNKGGGMCGASASLIDDYLTIDGRPFVGTERDEAKKVYGDELSPSKRDPRLAQTICTPGCQLRPNNGYTYQYPPLNGESYNQNTTGYSILKYVEYNTTYEPTIDQENKSQAAAIQFRYADVLLNYAEALAELDGAQYADKIKAALLPLRERVGMPGVDFDREYNQEADYPFHDLDKYIQAVRRERRVEKACEGRRLEDILRWAAADVLIVGKTPTGAMFVGSDLENNQFYYSNGNYQLIYDEADGNNLFLTGTPGSSPRYIIPFNNKNYPTGWGFKVDRDYLLPIENRMLSLTGNMWTQNPGW